MIYLHLKGFDRRARPGIEGSVADKFLLTTNPICLRFYTRFCSVGSMTADDKRIDPRIQSSNLISYVCHDEDDYVLKQGMGRTLNISEGGILLETHVPIATHTVVTLTIALEDEIMEFRGRITHSDKREDGSFTSGIEFIEMNEEKRRFLEQCVVFFTGQENMA
jgi:hypothetical protein